MIMTCVNIIILAFLTIVANFTSTVIASASVIADTRLVFVWSDFPLGLCLELCHRSAAV